MTKLTALSMTLLLAVPAVAQERFDPEARAKTIAPFLDDQTIAVACLDPTRMDADALATKFAALGEIAPKRLAEETESIRKFLADLKKTGVKEMFVVVSLADFPQNTPFVVVNLGDNTDADKVIALLRASKPIEGKEKAGFFNLSFEDVEKRGTAIFAGSKSARKRLVSVKASPWPELAKAFAAAGDKPLQLLFFSSADVRRVVEELLPTLPDVLGSGSVKVLTRGMHWGALGVDLGPKLSARFVSRSQDSESAKILGQWIVATRKLLLEKKEWLEVFRGFPKIASQFNPEIGGDFLTLKLDDDALSALLAPAVANAFLTSNLVQSSEHLKQIGLAFHNFHDAHDDFPNGVPDQNDKPLLSWRVQILPYVEEHKLWQEFHKDEPWDSPHNKKLIARIPPILQSSKRLAAQGKTTYQGLVGKATMFPPGEAVTIQGVTDGLANTIHVVQTDDDHAVIWTKPDDLKYDHAKPAAGWLVYPGKGYLTLFADGSIHVISVNTDPKTLRALITRNGGERVTVP